MKNEKSLLKRYPWAIAITHLEDGCGQTHSYYGDGITRACIGLHGVYATEAEAEAEVRRLEAARPHLMPGDQGYIRHYAVRPFEPETYFGHQELERFLDRRPERLAEWLVARLEEDKARAEEAVKARRAERKKAAREADLRSALLGYPITRELVARLPADFLAAGEYSLTPSGIDRWMVRAAGHEYDMRTAAMALLGVDVTTL